MPPVPNVVPTVVAVVLAVLLLDPLDPELDPPEPLVVAALVVPVVEAPLSSLLHASATTPTAAHTAKDHFMPQSLTPGESICNSDLRQPFVADSGHT
jgi:hypothetical protein